MATFGLRTHMLRTRKGHNATLPSVWRASLLLACGLPLTALTHAQGEAVQRIEVPASPSDFQPESARDVTLQFSGLAATFKASSPMVLVAESAGVRRNIPLTAEFAQLTSARLFKSDRLMITGMVNGDVSEVIVVDPEKAEVIDHFLCYSPAISPNGRYIAFVKFYPAHGVESVEDHYAIYDAQLNPSQNRPAAYPHHPGVVSKVVFPNGIQNKPSDNVDLDGLPPHRMISDGFFWNERSTIVTFADEFREEFSVVVVTLNDTLTTESLPIPKDWICPTGTDCFEHLARVEFMDQSKPEIELVFRGVNGTPARASRVLVSREKSGRIVVHPGG